jgi:predicted nucleic acid-binding protein
MAYPYVDTDVIIRLLTGDDPQKQARAALFEQVEARQLVLVAPATAIADAVYALSSPRLYGLPREDVAALLLPLVRLQDFRVDNRRTVVSALILYATQPNLDFGDAMIAASMREAGSTVLYSYDAHFDRIAEVARQEP